MFGENESPGVVGSWQYEGIPWIRQTPPQHLHHGCGPRTAHNVDGVEGGGRPEHSREQSCHSLREHGGGPLSHTFTSTSRRPRGGSDLKEGKYMLPILYLAKSKTPLEIQVARIIW